MRHRARPASDDIASGEVRDAAIPGHFVVLWRTTAGRLVACEGRCPHQWSPLDVEGVVDGEELVCRAHGWRFGVDGAGSKLNVKGRRDVKGPVAVYAVAEHADGIWVELP